MHEKIKGNLLAEVILAGNYIFCQHMQTKPKYVIINTCQSRGKVQYELLGCLDFFKETGVAFKRKILYDP